jgi:hypothetical protein
MRKDIATYGGLAIAIGLALFLSSGFIAETIFSESIATIETESFTEALEMLLDASEIANTMHGLLRILSLIIIVAGVVMFAIGGSLKEPKKKSFKKSKIEKKTYNRSPSKKAKTASFFVTGWGRKNRKPKKLKLKGNKKYKKYKSWTSKI